MMHINTNILTEIRHTLLQLTIRGSVIWWNVDCLLNEKLNWLKTRRTYTENSYTTFLW